MLAAFAFEALGVVVGDMYFVDPVPLAGQETPERGVRLEVRLVDRAEPQGSIYAGVPIAFTRPVWRVDIFGSTESPPGTLDRAHHHPRFDGWDPDPGTSSPSCSADPFLAGRSAGRSGCRAGSGRVIVIGRPKPIYRTTRRGRPGDCRRGETDADGVRDGELAPAPAEPVAAARTGWL